MTLSLGGFDASIVTSAAAAGDAGAKEAPLPSASATKIASERHECFLFNIFLPPTDRANAVFIIQTFESIIAIYQSMVNLIEAFILLISADKRQARVEFYGITQTERRI